VCRDAREHTLSDYLYTIWSRMQGQQARILVGQFTRGKLASQLWLLLQKADRDVWK